MKVELIEEVENNGMVSETTLGTFEADPQWCERFIAWAVNYSPSVLFRISDEDGGWTKDWTLSDSVGEP